MGTLAELLLHPERKPAFLREAMILIETEVDSKGGLGGMALKGAYKVVRTARADFVANALERLLPDFAARLEPLVLERGNRAPHLSLEAFFRDHAELVATALLAITDERARKAESGGRRTAYEKLRPAAHRHVEEAAPRIGKLLDRHLPPLAGQGPVVA